MCVQRLATTALRLAGSSERRDAAVDTNKPALSTDSPKRAQHRASMPRDQATGQTRTQENSTAQARATRRGPRLRSRATASEAERLSHGKNNGEQTPRCDTLARSPALRRQQRRPAWGFARARRRRGGGHSLAEQRVAASRRGSESDRRARAPLALSAS